MNDMQRRINALEATQARFKDRPFDWSKSATCIHLLRYHASKMGHKLPVVPRFRTALSAKKALLATGHGSLPELLDAYFVRIPPAFMLPGDVMALPGDSDLHAIAIKGERTKYLGWHKDEPGCQVLDVHTISDMGWRL